jgi:hypothetical protein
MEEQLSRIRTKIRARGIEVNAPASEAQVRAYEERHGVLLPSEYRSFLIRIGNGGAGPPAYGLAALGTVASDMLPEERATWLKLPDILKPFPFTTHWVWDVGDVSREGTSEQLNHGSLYIGNDGCGMYWHLIVTGPDRGIPWMLSGEGIQPVCPKRGFLQWYEDWLDGRDSFYGFPEPDDPNAA